MIRGSLDRFHLGDLLQWLQMGGLSGRLTILQHNRERRFDFLDGQVVLVSSTLAPERLATWLAAQRLLPAARLRQLLALSLLRRVAFTDLLLEHTDLGAEAIGRALRGLAEAITTRILLAPDADFTFDPSFPVRSLLRLSIDVEPNQLLFEAARRSDEGLDNDSLPPRNPLPAAGEAFETFFWQLIREGLSTDCDLDGERLHQLHSLIRDIVGTLAHWLAASPGLVPMPNGQAHRIAEAMEQSVQVELNGLPHAAWNQMVLACSVRSADLERPRTVTELETAASSIDAWGEMVGSEAWQRPSSAQLDDLTGRAATLWSLAASAAAPHLGVDPEAAALATHLITVPTDLVLWVLTTLPLPHQGVRRTLLRRLPERLGAALAERADFPAELHSLFAPDTAHPLGICLCLARETLPSAAVWPLTVPEDWTEGEVPAPLAMVEAREAALGAAEARAEDAAATR